MEAVSSQGTTSPLPTRRRSTQATGAAAVGAGLVRPALAWADADFPRQSQAVLSGSAIDLIIRKHNMVVAGRGSTAVTVNGSLPGPVLRLREGETVTIRARRRRAGDTGRGLSLVIGGRLWYIVA